MATHMESVRLSDDAMYSVQLGLYVIGYREFKDDDVSTNSALIQTSSALMFITVPRFMSL